MRKGVAAALAAAAAALLGAVLADAAPAARVELRPEALVDGDAIHLGDIAAIEASSESLLAELRALYVGRSPLPGSSRTVSAGEVLLRMRQARLTSDQIELIAPEGPTLVTAAGRTLDRTAILEAVEEWYVRSRALPEGAVLVLEVDASGVAVPPGEIEIRPALFAPSWGKFSAPFELFRDGEFLRRINVTIAARLVQTAPVAARPLARGELVGEADVAYAAVELAAPLDSWLVPGKVRAARFVPEGTVLSARWVERAPDVERGAVVPVAAKVGSVVALLTGIAAEDGFVGGPMAVVNPESGKRLYGTLSPDGVVWVAGGP